MSFGNNLKAIILRGLSKKTSVDFNIKNSSKVLMLRYDRIGDMVITTPVFRELKNKTDDEIDEIRRDLLKYCWLDTYAMYAIYKKLLTIVNN